MFSDGRTAFVVLVVVELFIVNLSLGQSVANQTTAEPEARCAVIPVELSSCLRLGYRQMRVPNLLNDDSRSSSSLPVSCDDNDDSRLLACSLLAPVCIDHPIWPCRSLCMNVTSACRQSLIDCDRLPSDDELCLRPDSSGGSALPLGRPLRRKGGNRRERKRRGRKRSRGTSSRRRVQRERRNRKRYESSYGSRTDHAAAAEDAAQTLMSLNTRVQNSSMMSSCDVCADQLQRSEFFERLCSADFVAKVRPVRYIRARFNLKLVAAKAVKFYKQPEDTTSSSAGRRRTVFFVDGELADVNSTPCPCLQATDGKRTTGRSDRSDSIIVAGRVDRLRRARNVVTVAVPFLDRKMAQRAIRVASGRETVCQRRLARLQSKHVDGAAGKRRGRNRKNRADVSKNNNDDDDRLSLRRKGRRRKPNLGVSNAMSTEKRSRDYANADRRRFGAK